jgi:hypothetical protein
MDRQLEADPKPFVWTKTAEEILDSRARSPGFPARDTSGSLLIRDVEVQAAACRDRVDQGLQLRGHGDVSGCN